MSELLAGLNNEQLRAVTWPAKSALVLAGAGSGKTRVLTTRIAWLIATGQVNPAGVLAVTFTNKAAREMHTRLGAMVPVNVRTMWIGTFHGLCNRFLRAHYRDAGLPQTFQILDSADQQAAIKRLLKSMELSDEKYPPRAVQSFINGSKEAGVRAERLPPPLTPYEAKLHELYAAYDAQCRREGVVDFAELLLRSYELLQANAALRAHYQGRFRHILVDEFQDTNRLQYAWLKLLSGEHNVLFAVGDDDQSIYAFRGAEVGNMRALLSDFQVAEPVRLEQNYRSVGTILTAANALIERNDGRLGKNLWTDAGEGEQIRLYEAYSDGDEAQFIIDEVKSLQREGMNLSDMAILYRSNAQSRVLEHVLVNAQLAYRIYGGLRFFERLEVKHALAYLRLVSNPDDDNALLRVINVPARGIGARTVENLQAVSREQGVTLWQACCAAGGGRTAAKLGEFVLLIEALRSKAEGMTLAETVSLIIDHSGLRAMYEQDKKEGEERLANLDELVAAATHFLGSGSGFNDDDFEEVVEKYIEYIPSVTRIVGEEITQVRKVIPLQYKKNKQLMRYAKSMQNNSLVSIDEVVSGLAAQCLCLSCGERVVAHKGEKNKHHFSHDEARDNTANCIERSYDIAEDYSFELESVVVPKMEVVVPAQEIERSRVVKRQKKNLVLVEFLSAASLEAGEHQAEAGEDALQLMTVHAAKGLEFDAVFVSGLEEGLFPHENSMNDSKGLEEERRLMYVAVTRARKRLYLSCAQSRMLHGQSRYPVRSRFVEEIPAELVRVLSATVKPVPQNTHRRAPWLDEVAAPAVPAAQLQGFRIGQSVGHAKFGSGVVINAEGSGSDLRLQINFAEHGLKWLDLRYAKLTAE